MNESFSHVLTCKCCTRTRQSLHSEFNVSEKTWEGWKRDAACDCYHELSAVRRLPSRLETRTVQPPLRQMEPNIVTHSISENLFVLMKSSSSPAERLFTTSSLKHKIRKHFIDPPGEGREGGSGGSGAAAAEHKTKWEHSCDMCTVCMFILNHSTICNLLLLPQISSF